MHGAGRVVLILMSWVICSWQPPSSSSSNTDTQVQRDTVPNTKTLRYQIQRHRAPNTKTHSTKYKNTQIPNTNTQIPNPKTHRYRIKRRTKPNTKTHSYRIHKHKNAKYQISDYMLHIKCQKQNVGVYLTLVGYNCPWFAQYLLAVSLAIKQIRPADVFLRILQVSNPSFVTEKRPRPPKFQSGGE